MTVFVTILLILLLTYVLVLYDIHNKYTFEPFGMFDRSIIATAISGDPISSAYIPVYSEIKADSDKRKRNREIKRLEEEQRKKDALRLKIENDYNERKTTNDSYIEAWNLYVIRAPIINKLVELNTFVVEQENITIPNNYYSLSRPLPQSEVNMTEMNTDNIDTSTLDDATLKLVNESTYTISQLSSMSSKNSDIEDNICKCLGIKNTVLFQDNVTRLIQKYVCIFQLKDLFIGDMGYKIKFYIEELISQYLQTNFLIPEVRNQIHGSVNEYQHPWIQMFQVYMGLNVQFSKFNRKEIDKIFTNLYNNASTVQNMFDRIVEKSQDNDISLAESLMKSCGERKMNTCKDALDAISTEKANFLMDNYHDEVFFYFKPDSGVNVIAQITQLHQNYTNIINSLIFYKQLKGDDLIYYRYVEYYDIEADNTLLRLNNFFAEFKTYYDELLLNAEYYVYYFDIYISQSAILSKKLFKDMIAKHERGESITETANTLSSTQDFISRMREVQELNKNPNRDDKYFDSKGDIGRYAAVDASKFKEESGIRTIQANDRFCEIDDDNYMVCQAPLVDHNVYSKNIFNFNVFESDVNDNGDPILQYPTIKLTDYVYMKGNTLNSIHAVGLSQSTAGSLYCSDRGFTTENNTVNTDKNGIRCSHNSKDRWEAFKLYQDKSKAGTDTYKLQSMNNQESGDSANVGGFCRHVNRNDPKYPGGTGIICDGDGLDPDDGDDFKITPYVAPTY